MVALPAGVSNCGCCCWAGRGGCATGGAEPVNGRLPIGRTGGADGSPPADDKPEAEAGGVTGGGAAIAGAGDVSAAVEELLLATATDGEAGGALLPLVTGFELLAVGVLTGAGTGAAAGDVPAAAAAAAEAPAADPEPLPEPAPETVAPPGEGGVAGSSGACIESSSMELTPPPAPWACDWW